MPNLAWVQEPPKISQYRSLLRCYMWLYIVVYADHDEIWHGRVCHGPVLTCQICPRWGWGMGTRTRKDENLVKITVFAFFWGFTPTSSPLLFLPFPSLPYPFPSSFPLFLSFTPLFLPSFRPLPFFPSIFLIFPSLSLPIHPSFPMGVVNAILQRLG